FKRIEKIGLKKLHIQQEYPQVFDFLVAAMQEESTEVSYIIRQKIDPLYEEGTEKLYKNIDYSKFREGIDVEKAINILTCTMYGYGEKGLRELKNFNNLEDFGEYYLQVWKHITTLL